MTATAAARLLYVLSPAKTLDMTRSAVSRCSEPALLRDAHDMVAQLQQLSQAKVKALLGVSDALAKLNYQRFQDFDTSPSKAPLAPSELKKQAVLAFNGPAYQGLAAHELSDAELAYAQDHLRILCGLYGILRPLDLIQAYRLEMGQRFANSRGKDLYAFWGSTLAHAINETFARDATSGESKVLVNLASQEYFKSLPLDALDADVRVVDCVFQDDGKIKSVYAKRARGLMCRYLIQHQVASVDGIKAFDLEGYAFAPAASSDSTLVFNRSAAKQKQVLQQIQAKAKQAKEEQQRRKSESAHDDPTAVSKSTRAAPRAGAAKKLKVARSDGVDGSVDVSDTDPVSAERRVTRASASKKRKANC